MVKGLFSWLFKFDEYIKPFLFLLGLLLVVALPDCIRLYGFFKGLLILIGASISYLLFLHIYQAFCRLLRIDKLYYNRKQELMKTFKKRKDYPSGKRNFRL